MCSPMPDFDFDNLETPEHWVPLGDIEQEMLRQYDKWGEQNHPDHTGPDTTFMFHKYRILADLMRRRNDINHSEGNDTWDIILLEEVFEALSETDEDNLYKELTQVAAVCGSWMMDIKRRKNGSR